MSLAVPQRGWYRAPAGAEKLWIGLALIWCFVMSVMMPFWHFRGKQNSRGEAYAVQPAAFLARTEQFAAANKVGERNGVTIAEPAPGGDAYLMGRMWSWFPILKLRQGVGPKVQGVQGEHYCKLGIGKGHFCRVCMGKPQLAGSHQRFVSACRFGYHRFGIVNPEQS